jgi:putative hydrolase of HD superfamily
MERSESAGLTRFLQRIGRLKFTPRTGWLDRGVPTASTESVADHSFRMALLAWLAALDSGATLDSDRVLKLALIHDLAEAVTGDPTPYAATAVPTEDGSGARRTFLQQWHVRSPEEAARKRQAEAAAMAGLVTDLSPGPAAELSSLWAEYAAQATPEARFVKQADRLETYLQSREYLEDDPERPMASFTTEVGDTIVDPGLRQLRDAIAAIGRLDQE